MVEKIFRFEAIPPCHSEEFRTAFEETYLRFIAAAREYARSLWSAKKPGRPAEHIRGTISFSVYICLVLNQRWCESADGLEQNQ